jgi:adenine-specific DNA-methyltransferase
MRMTESRLFFSDIPERQYCDITSSESRKALGQFFTPYPVAQFMAKWVAGTPNLRKVLDPAAGLGVFFRAILEETQQLTALTAFDIDSRVLDEAEKLFENVSDALSFKSQDYLLSDWSEKYDGIICNPPYFRFQNFSRRSEILMDFQLHLQMKLTGLTNLHSLFLLKASQQLSEGGRAAFIVPSEFLNSDYGKRVKHYLLKHGVLKYIILFDYRSNVFEDAITTSAILLLANDNSSRINFVTVHSQDELIELSTRIRAYPSFGEIGSSYSSDELDPLVKWRRYYQGLNGGHYVNLVPFTKYARVMRGIATGDNDYFTFGKTQIREHRIKTTSLLPCITKASHSKSSFFTSDDFEDLKSQDKRCYLLNAVDSRDESVIKYIKLGEKKGVNQRYLTKNRNPWYSLENRPPAPFWVSVFTRGGLRFVRNEAMVRNLTCFHGIYPLHGFEEDMELLFGYFLTPTSMGVFSNSRREYGNGLDKFEPHDVNHAMVPNVSIMNEEERCEIRALLKQYRNAVTSQLDGSSLISAIDSVFSRFLTESVRLEERELVLL